jgi:bacteriocin biosynthesis cyclodehydratase domain-containing protein
MNQQTSFDQDLRMLPARIAFRQSLTIASSSPTQMQLRSGESEVILIRGNAVSKLIPALLLELNGSRAWSDVINQLEHIASPEVIQACIEQLFEQGVLVEVNAASEHLGADQRALLSFFSHSPFVPEQILEKVQNANIGTFCEDGLESALIHCLRRHGFQHFRPLSNDLPNLQAQAKGLDLLIVLAPHMEASTLDDINLTCLKKGTPWLPVDLYSGSFCSLGPLVIPGSGPCYECYRSRVRSNIGANADAYDEFLTFQRRERINVSHYGMLPSGIDISFGFVCLEALKLITQFHTPACLGHNVIVNLLTLDVQRHRVLQIPRCSACSRSDVVPQGHWQ